MPAGGALTATRAGELLGESSASCSFHLRQLAKYGLVEEAGGGHGRERPWQATAMLTDVRLSARFGIGRVCTASCLVFTAPVALVPLAGGPKPVILAMLFAAEFVSGFGVMALDICLGSIFAAVIPDQLKSRVSGAFQAVNYGTRPLGALAGGFLGTVLGLRPTLWIAAIGGLAGFAVLLPSPLPRFRLPSGS